MLMGESRLLEPFLTEAMMTYAAPKPSEVGPRVGVGPVEFEGERISS
jgi:hypothetical protein